MEINTNKKRCKDREVVVSAPSTEVHSDGTVVVRLCNADRNGDEAVLWMSVDEARYLYERLQMAVQEAERGGIRRAMERIGER